MEYVIADPRQRLFNECAIEVEKEFQMSGLSGDLYEEFAWQTMGKFLSRAQGSGSEAVENRYAMALEAYREWGESKYVHNHVSFPKFCSQRLNTLTQSKPTGEGG